jgi:uncharacterized protein (TIGR03546 family)
MTPLKWLRKIGKFIRGGTTPIQILLAAMLGLMLGLVPGFNMTHVLIIVALLIINVSLGIAITCFLVGKGLMLLLLPVSIHLENWAIIYTPLAAVMRWAGDTPVLALMRLEQPGVFGGIVLAIVLGMVTGIFLASVVLRIRRLLVKFGAKSEKARRIVSLFPIRILLWLLFGGQKRPLAELMEYRAPLLRKWGAVVALVFVGLTVVGAVVAVDFYLAGKLEAAMGKVNGAEVNIAHADLSVLGARVRLAGVQVTDPAKPTHNRFQAEELIADISITGLLTGRFIADEIVAPGTPRIDAPREKPGEVYEPPKAPESKNPQDLLWEWLQDPEAVKKFFDRLETAREWLEKIRERMKEKQQEETEGPISDEYMAWLSRNRKEILTKKPTVLVRRLVLDRIRMGPEKLYRVEGRNLSSHPEYVEKEMVIRVGDLTESSDGELAFAQGLRVFVGFNFHSLDVPHTMEIRVSDLELGRTLKLSDKSPLDFSKGKATVVANGHFSAADMNLPATVTITDYAFKTREGRKFLGMNPQTMGRVVGAMDTFPVVMRMTGPISRPVVRIEPQATLEAFGKSGAPRAILQGAIGNLGDWLNRNRDEDDGNDDDTSDDGDDRPNPLDLIPGF